MIILFRESSFFLTRFFFDGENEREGKNNRARIPSLIAEKKNQPHSCDGFGTEPR